ncbi:MAG: hypothetical protein KDA37_12950 [Planctomycetales bacterium]|nr:hypothetical protein [Planctomycetales bacterium]
MLQGNWLSRVCSELEAEYGVAISDYARQFILQTAVAFRFDPHPDWGTSADVPTDTLEGLIRDQLADLVRSEPVQRSGMVTYFHVLHWFMDGGIALRGFPVPK